MCNNSAPQKRFQSAPPLVHDRFSHRLRREHAHTFVFCRPGVNGQYPLYANYPRDIAPPCELGRLGGVLTSWLADQLAPARIVVMNQKGRRHGPRPRPVCWLVTAWIRTARICIKLKFPNFMQIQKRSQAAPQLAPRREQSQRALRGELLASHRKWMEAAILARIGTGWFHIIYLFTWTRVFWLWYFLLTVRSCFACQSFR